MDDIPSAVPSPPLRLMDQFRAWLRGQNYRYATERTYVHWVLAYIRFHGRRHPREMGAAEIEAFLNHLVARRNCSVATQKIVLNALNCFYRKFLKIDYPDLAFRRSVRKPRVPVVFTDEEARALISELVDPWRLMAEIMYGAGLRVSEMLRLRIKDIDFGQRQIIVRDGKGGRDRVTLLPDSLSDRIQKQVEIEYYAGIRLRYSHCAGAAGPH